MEKQKILIIDDDSNIGKTLSDFLKIKGYETSVALNGMEGLALLKTFPADIAVLDLGLPDMSGLDVLREIKANYPLTETIILTGNASLNSAMEAINKGAFSYLVKPCEMDELMLLIKRAIEKQVAEEIISRHSYEMEAINALLNKANLELTHEIYERKRAEENLFNSEQKFRSIFENAGDAIFLMRDGIFVDCNRKTLEIFQCSRDEIIGQAPYRFSPALQPDGSNSKASAVRKMQEAYSGTPQFFEWMHCRHDGTLFRAEVSLNTLELSGELLLQAIIRDITYRKRTEEDLLNSEQKLKAVIYSSPTPQFVIDQNHLVVHWNKALEEITGVAASEIIGTTRYRRVFYETERPCMADLVIMEDIEKIPELYTGKYDHSRLMGGVYEATDYFPLLGKGGKWLHFTSTAFRDTNGRVIGAVETLEDITERKQTEEALRESEERYRTILASIEEGYYEVDLKGNLTFFNDSFCKTLGYSRDEIYGMNFKQYLDKQNAQKAFTMFSQVFKTGIPAKAVDWQFLRKDGTKCCVEASVSLKRDREGHLTGFQGIARDVSERREAEIKIQRISAIQNLILDNSTLGIALVRNRKFEWVNARLGELLMLPVDQIQGASTRVIYPSDEMFEELGKTSYPTLARGERSDNTFKLQRNDGTLFWCRFIGKALNPANPQDGSIWMVEDITEQKLAEEKIRHISAIQNLILDNSTLGIALVRNRKFEWVNNRLGELLMLPLEKMQGYSCRVIYPSDEAYNELGKVAYPAMKRGERSEIVLQLQRSDGSLFWCRFIGKALNPAIPHDLSIWMFEDITERKQTEEALRESEEKYSRFFNTSRDCAFITSKEGRWIDLNDASVEMFGYDNLDELMKVKVADVYADPADRQKHISTIMEFGHAKEYPVNMRKKDGTVINTLITSVARLDNQGNVMGFQGTIRDVTKRRQAEELLERIIAASPMAIFIIVHGKLQMANSQFEVFTGYNRDEYMGKSLATIIHQEDRDKVIQAGHKMLKNKETLPYEYRAITKAGKVRTFMETVSRIQYRGEAAVLGNFIDITDRKALERQLMQAQKLESVGQLAAGIAHEINTPAQFVGDNTSFLKNSFQDLVRLIQEYELLLDAVKKGEVNDSTVIQLENAKEETDFYYLEEEIPKAIDQSLEGIERISKIVRAMREFSHPGTGEKALADINQIIENTIVISRNEWKYVADMETNYDTSLKLVPCLQAEFSQVILNIIVNAAQAMAGANEGKDEAMGKITVETRFVDNEAEVRISDTGPGIPDNIKDKVFDFFFTTKEVGKGSGQGLAIARSIIVDKHHGSITCEDREGGGTLFIIRLPLS